MTTDRLIDDLWGERPTASAPTALQGYVSTLRRLLEPERPPGAPSDLLATVSGGYALRIDDEQVDAARFERLVERGRRARAQSRLEVAAHALSEALALWRGDALGELAGEPWASVEARRLDELRVAALEDWLDVELRRGRHEEVVGTLEALVAQHPLRERLRALLMLALYRSGRQADALDQYRDARQTLDAELGLMPGSDLQRLERAILNHDAALDAPRLAAASRARLPRPPSSFVGRARELAELRDHLLHADVRLVTLTGVGGSGKTRLALEVGHAIESRFAEGAIFVSLAGVSEPALVLPAIARALDIPEGDRAPLETLSDALADSELLLIVDNFEHVADAATSLPDLLAAAPDTRVLATSRSPLHVTGELEYPVPPLEHPEAVALFCERAHAVALDFELTKDTEASVTEICSRLDGLPLALELAAARTRHLSPQSILRRLDQRFRLLVAGPRDLPDRQRTLGGAMDWSYDLLDEAEQELFRAVSVFGGTFDAGLVEQVCAPSDESLELLLSLLDKSLLRRSETADGEPSFSMLVTVREYAHSRLDAEEKQRLHQRHAAYVLELAERADPALSGPDQAQWLERLEQALDDIRAAVRWLLEHDAELALEIVNRLYLLWYLHGHLTEARGWILAALDRTAPETIRQAKAFRVLGALAEHQGDFDRARTLGETSLELYRRHDDSGSVAACLNNLGAIAVQQTDYDRGRKLFEESIEIKRGLGDRRGVALTTSNLAILETKDGRYAAARALHEDVIPTLRELGMMTPLANSLSSLAELELVDGDPPRARPLVDETLEIRRELGDRGGTADALITMTRVSLREGDALAALVAARTSLEVSRETGDQEGVAAALEAVGDAVAGLGDHAVGLTLRGAASSVRSRIGAPLAPIDVVFAEGTLAPARSVLGATLFADAWKRGVEHSLEEAVELADQVSAVASLART